MIFHCYNISSDASVIFYKDVDYIVFLSLVSVYSRQHGQKVLSMCIMRNHYHILIDAESESELIQVMSKIQSRFSREYNSRDGKDGVRICFKSSFGRDEKRTPKNIRTCMIYIANNPVEKSQCSKADEYRWNMLPYLNYETPGFVRPYSRKSSKAFRLACSSLRSAYTKGHALTYDLMCSIKARLSENEFVNFCDYAINLYNPVDFPSVLNYFGDYKSFLLACDSTTGSEYGVGEEYHIENYRHYDRLLEEVEKIAGRHSDLLLPSGAINIRSHAVMDVLRLAYEGGLATDWEIARFFHIKNSRFCK